MKRTYTVYEAINVINGLSGCDIACPFSCDIKAAKKTLQDEIKKTEEKLSKLRDAEQFAQGFIEND